MTELLQAGCLFFYPTSSTKLLTNNWGQCAAKVQSYGVFYH